MKLKQLIIKSVSKTTVTALLNLLGTVVVVRWFGADVYANYLVDLAYLALLTIVIEIVPSNYLIFRIQDIPERVRGLAALSVMYSMMLIPVAWGAESLFELYNAYSFWMILYVCTLSSKRFLDTRLQSSGRLDEYFAIDLYAAVIRLCLLGVFLFWNMNATDAVWAALACSAVMAQVFWFYRNPIELAVFRFVGSRSVWRPLLSERSSYVPYYFGIIFKRINGNLLPIFANVYFVSKEDLGAFFLAYRGLVFTLGQVRILEGLLNFRDTLEEFHSVGIAKRILICLLAQILCVLSSVALIYLSGTEEINMVLILVLSLAVWPGITKMIKRASLYSEYKTLPLNISMIVYSLVFCLLGFLLMWLQLNSEIALAYIILLAELVSLASIYLLSRKTLKNIARPY